MKHSIPKERLKELQDISGGLYETIRGLCNDPFEAVTVVSIIHLMVWLNGKAEGSSTRQMLEDYCHNFTINAKANEETLQ